MDARNVRTLVECSPTPTEMVDSTSPQGSRNEGMASPERSREKPSTIKGKTRIEIQKFAQVAAAKKLRHAMLHEAAP